MIIVIFESFISQGSAATQIRCGRYLVTILFYLLKFSLESAGEKIGNRPIFCDDMDKSLQLTCWGHSVRIMQFGHCYHSLCWIFWQPDWVTRRLFKRLSVNQVTLQDFSIYTNAYNNCCEMNFSRSLIIHQNRYRLTALPHTPSVFQRNDKRTIQGRRGWGRKGKEKVGGIALWLFGG